MIKYFALIMTLLLLAVAPGPAGAQSDDCLALNRLELLISMWEKDKSIGPGPLARLKSVAAGLRDCLNRQAGEPVYSPPDNQPPTTQPPRTQPPLDQTGVCDWTGQWRGVDSRGKSNGRLELSQTGDRIVGRMIFDRGDARIEGRADGDRVELVVIHDNAVGIEQWFSPEVARQLVGIKSALTLRPDRGCDRLTGEYQGFHAVWDSVGRVTRRIGADDPQAAKLNPPRAYRLERLGAAPAPPTPPTTSVPPPQTPVGSDGRADFSGRWRTTYGAMDLNQSGDRVTGRYSYRGGRIEGRVTGGALVGRWSQDPDHKPPFNAGRIEFRLGPDGRSWTGRWRTGEDGDWQEGWSGRR